MNVYHARVLALAQRITLLEAELEKARAEFAALLPPTAPGTDPTAEPSARPEKGFGTLAKILAEARPGLAAHQSRSVYVIKPDEPAGEDVDDASLTKRIINLMEQFPENTFDAEGVHHALSGVANIDSVRSTLARLARNRRIEKVGHGEYGARRQEPTSSAPPQVKDPW